MNRRHRTFLYALLFSLLLQPAFQTASAQVYLPDESFQSEVRRGINQIYESLLSGLDSLPVYDNIRERESEARAFKKSKAVEIEKFFDEIATLPSQAIDFFFVAEEMFYSQKEIEWDDAFEAVLRKVIARNDLEPVYKSRPNYILSFISKNRVGDCVADFEFLSSDNKISKLSELEGEYTLLVFGSEGCNDCARFKSDLKSKFYQGLVESGTLSILYITITNDLDFWKKRVKLPKHVVSGFDVYHYITDKTNNYTNPLGPLFELGKYPVVYLLDGKTGEIVLKEIDGDNVKVAIKPYMD